MLRIAVSTPARVTVTRSLPFRCSEALRLFHSSTIVSASEDSENGMGQLFSKHGKKLKPKQDHFVVLTPRETGVIRLPKRSRVQNSRASLSVLEGYDLKRHSEKDTKFSQVQDLDILSNIQETTDRLMQFKEQEDNEEMAKAIDACKPSSNTISEKRYFQLEKVLDEQFTLQQLRNYCFLKHGTRKSRVPKKDLIPMIINKFWKCTIDHNKSEFEDLVVENEILLEKRDLYLLLLTKNGRILQNLSRIGATIAVLPEQNKLVVRCPSQLFRYVEVSITKILENIVSDDFCIKEFVKNHSLVGETASMTPLEMMNLLQTQSPSYIEVTEDDKYRISTIGNKSLKSINSLLLWILNYEPQISQSVINIQSDSSDARAERYRVGNYNWINWVARRNSWFRLQNPVPINQDQNQEKKPDLSEKMDSIWDALKLEKTKCAKPLAFNDSRSLTVTLGHVLQSEDNSNTLFQSKVAEVIPKVLRLPLWEENVSEEDMLTMDQHLYLVQMKFVPNLASVQYKVNVPPVEVWFTLDEMNYADLSTVSCIHHYADSAALLQTPSLPYDFKISQTSTIDVIPKDLESADVFEWLEKEQPGFRKFLQDAHLTFSDAKKPRYPQSFTLNVKLEGNSEPQPIEYNAMGYFKHRVLRFRYKDKYLVHYSETNGGPLGGITSSVDFINLSENIDKQTVHELLDDVIQF